MYMYFIHTANKETMTGPNPTNIKSCMRYNHEFMLIVGQLFETSSVMLDYMYCHEVLVQRIV